MAWSRTMAERNPVQSTVSCRAKDKGMSRAQTTGKHIVAMGGGGFSEEPDNLLLDDYVLSLTRKRKPKVCFLPTASGDAQGYIDKFYGAFPSKRAKSSHLTLFRSCGVQDPREFLLHQDIIYVGGGSTVNMLAIWRLHGIDRVLRKAWRTGVVLAGLSAGMICWFEQCLTYSFGGRPTALTTGLGLLKGSACPHYSTEPGDRLVYQRLVAKGSSSPGVAAEDGAALHFVGGKLARVVSSRKEARAYRVKRGKNNAVETPLDTYYLGRDKSSQPDQLRRPAVDAGRPGRLRRHRRR